MSNLFWGFDFVYLRVARAKTHFLFANAAIENILVARYKFVYCSLKSMAFITTPLNAAP
jgi:hypothetical protein